MIDQLTPNMAFVFNPLETKDDLDPLLDRIGDAHYVLLGEASHGTHEYYTWRARISQRLIEEKGFSFIAVEGDWPDCYNINRFIKGYPNAAGHILDVLKRFDRWPTWMWANYEITAFASWLRQHNDRQLATNKVGFYGLDVYSLWESIDVLMQVLEQQDPQAARHVREVVACFEPYGEDERRYAQAAAYLSESCKKQVMAMLAEIRAKAATYDHEPEASLNAEMNAWVAVNAERYYESMYAFDDNSWNIRDTHMAETLKRLMDYHSPAAKCIVWAHNTHIGDARYTDMQHHGMINLGQLVRQQQMEAPEPAGRSDVVLVGFGSYEGRVIAGRRWDAPMEVMEMPRARTDSTEEMLHNKQATNQLIIFDSSTADEVFQKEQRHRAIGVVYNPEQERLSNYVPTVLARRYDAFLYFDKTRALHPLHLQPDPHQVPEGYPFGV